MLFVIDVPTLNKVLSYLMLQNVSSVEMPTYPPPHHTPCFFVPCISARYRNSFYHRVLALFQRPFTAQKSQKTEPDIQSVTPFE